MDDTIYAVAVLSLFALVALVAVFLILGVDFQRLLPQTGLRGAATETTEPSGVIISDNLEPEEQETYIIEGIQYTISYDGDDIIINGKSHNNLNFPFGKGLYFAGTPTSGGVSFFVTRFTNAPSCLGITGQIKANGPGTFCCKGEVKTVPDCSGDNGGEVYCGNKRIYCDEGILKSEIKTDGFIPGRCVFNSPWSCMGFEYSNEELSLTIENDEEPIYDVEMKFSGTCDKKLLFPYVDPFESKEISLDCNPGTDGSYHVSATISYRKAEEDFKHTAYGFIEGGI